MNLVLALMTLIVGEVQSKWGWNTVGMLYVQDNLFLHE